MDNNIHKITFTNDKSNVVNLYQWDKGQVLEFVDSFPAGTEVQFGSGEVKVITNNKIAIPDAVLKTFGAHRAWIQLIGTNDETTILNIFFFVEQRSKKNDYVEPEDETSFREEMQTLLNAKQDKLTAGSNITITNNVISASGGSGASTWDEISGKPSTFPPSTHTHSQYLTEHQDISGKANVGDSYTKAESDAKYLTEHQSLSGYATETWVNSSLSEKQNTLISGTNIKTVNNQSILGNGNIVIDSGTVNYGNLTNKPSINNVTLSGNKSLSDLGINNLSTSDVDTEVQTYWNTHKTELKGDKGEKGDPGTTDYNNLTNKPTIPTVPTNVSAFTNDSGYLTEHQDISGKQDKLTVGSNITITNNVISATTPQLRLIRKFTLEEDVNDITISLDNDGNPFELKNKFFFCIYDLNKRTKGIYGDASIETGHQVYLRLSDSYANGFYSHGMWYPESTTTAISYLQYQTEISNNFLFTNFAYRTQKNTTGVVDNVAIALSNGSNSVGTLHISARNSYDGREEKVTMVGYRDTYMQVVAGTTVELWGC